MSSKGENMITETMTIHEALSELKMLDKRIRSAIQRGTFCTTNKHSNQKINGKSIRDFEADVKSSFDSINSLISRRAAIRNALSASNAKTTVSIAGMNLSIAEAIEMKNSGIENYRVLLERLDYQYQMAITEINRTNGDALQKKADDYVTNLYGPSKDKAVDAETVAKARETYIAANTVDFIDPLHLKNEIENLDAFIEKFRAEVDSKISISNALTTIEVSYE